jgi:tRNA 2-thiocytidine biosynthesis protein TtcA
VQLPRELNRRVGRALHDYAMLADGDRVLVAVSGGIDSLVLLWLLVHWRRKAPIDYRLLPVHVDMAPNPDGRPGEAAGRVAALVARLGLETEILPALWRPEPRTQLFAHARTRACTTIAFGHHRDDIIETFLLNLTCAGNISTMVPRQALFGGNLHLIRPLAYLDKTEIETLGRDLGFAPVRSACPLGENTRRRDMHDLALEIERRVPGARARLFAALGNVRGDYLLRQGGGRRP